MNDRDDKSWSVYVCAVGEIILRSGNATPAGLVALDSVVTASAHQVKSSIT